MDQGYALALTGGLALGLSGAAFLFINGRVLGVSGILNALTDVSARATRLENLAFLLGLIAVPGILAHSGGSADTNASSNLALLGLAGLLIGIGARMANGCTSGHSISGASRFSLRSIIASLLFFVVAAAVFAVLHHGLGVAL